MHFLQFISRTIENRDFPRGSQRFEYFTKDNIKISVKLFVAYRINDPKLCMKVLTPDEIDRHIERVTHVDMAAAAQGTNMQTIEQSDMTKIENNSDRVPFSKHIQDMVKVKLSEDMKEIGIELVRLNIESLDILDAEVRKRMNVQSSRLNDMTTKIKEQEAEKEYLQVWAENERTRQFQTTKIMNEQNLAKAENEQAVMIKVAEGKKRAMVIEAEGKKESEDLVGAALKTNRELFELRHHELSATAMSKVGQLIIAPEELQKFFLLKGSNTMMQ